MRRTVALLALSLVVAVVGACGAVGSQSGSRHVSLSFLYASASAQALEEMAIGARAAASETTGVSLDVRAPPGPATDAPAQVELFRRALKSTTDGVAYQTNTPDAFVVPLQEARTAKVPLIAVDTPPPPSSGIGTYIGNSNFEVGQQLVTDLLSEIPEGATGQVVIGTPLPGFPVLDQRITGMLQVLKQQRPSVQVVGPFNSRIVPADNVQAWTAEVAQYPNALAYLSPVDVDAASLAEVQRQTGRHLLVGACDLEDDALHALQEGLVHTLVSPEHWLKGYLAVRLLADHAQNGSALPHGWWNPGTLVVNQSNVADIVARQRDTGARARWFAARVSKELANPSQYVKPLSAAT